MVTTGDTIEGMTMIEGMIAGMIVVTMISDTSAIMIVTIEATDRRSAAFFSSVSSRMIISELAHRTLRISFPTVGFFLQLEGEIHRLPVAGVEGPCLACVSLDDQEDASPLGHDLEANAAARLQSV